MKNLSIQTPLPLVYYIQGEFKVDDWLPKYRNHLCGIKSGNYAIDLATYISTYIGANRIVRKQHGLIGKVIDFQELYKDLSLFDATVDFLNEQKCTEENSMLIKKFAYTEEILIDMGIGFANSQIDSDEKIIDIMTWQDSWYWCLLEGNDGKLFNPRNNFAYTDDLDGHHFVRFIYPL